MVTDNGVKTAQICNKFDEQKILIEVVDDDDDNKLCLKTIFKQKW
jgi:hypothetical protein